MKTITQFQSIFIPSIQTSVFPIIPSFPRFQWLNHPKVIGILAGFLQPPKKGRKGYDKALMFRWLIWKQLMSCSYRDLEGISGGIDYSTFIKFRQRLISRRWFAKAFKVLGFAIASQCKSLFLLLDSSFVETYSRRKEQGSEYSGYKKKIGFKLHQIIDYQTRLPLRQISTGGARSDIMIARDLIRGSPRKWRVEALAADKGYDGAEFVYKVWSRWKGVKIAIPLRRTSQEKITGQKESDQNRALKAAERCLDLDLLNKRTEIERYFSRKKRVFHLGEERTRHLKNFRANCYLTSIAEILEWLTTPSLWIQLFTKLLARVW